jgi:hypothetical protein
MKTNQMEILFLKLQPWVANKDLHGCGLKQPATRLQYRAILLLLKQWPEQSLVCPPEEDMNVWRH